MLHSKHNCKNVLRPTNPKPLEVNPKIIPLHYLVENIDEKVLAYHLERISVFLKDKKKDLRFPKLTPYLDAFLVRVIRHVNNLQRLLDVFDSRSRAFAEDIINSLNQDECLYYVAYSYEHSQIEADTLIYRKVYYPRGNPPMVTKNSESLYVRTDKPPRKDISWVKATHVFVTDSNCTLLEYPPMDYSEAQLIYSVVKLQCKDVSHLGPLCEDLVDAISDLNETTDLKATYLYLNSKQVQLSIEKKPRVSNGVKSNGDIQKPPSTPKNDPKTKAEKMLLNRKQLIDSLSKAFINTTLKTISNFISTESEASLVFKNANENQWNFIQSACAMARTPKFYGLFASDSVQILKDIAKLLNANQCYELRVDVSKAQKDNNLRTVTFTKHPKESDKIASDKTKSNSPMKAIAFETGDKLEQVIGGIVMGNQPKQEQKPPEKEVKQPEKNNPTKNQQETTQNVADKDKKPPNETKSIVPSLIDTKMRPSRSEHKEVDTKRAKSVPPQQFVKEIGNQKVDQKKLCIRKLKLLEAMSIPMESDIAMRMMNRMGWDGGPLGLRGEGITEPVIPALHLATKAGLGHVKVDIKVAGGFKLNIVQQILALMTQDAMEYRVEYEVELSDAEIKYLVETIKVLNSRKKVNESVGEIRTVIVCIVEEMFCQDVEISCDVKPDKKHLTLTKKKMTTKKDTTALPNDRDKIVMLQCANLPKIISTDSAKAIGILYDKNLALRTGTRIILQYTVMDFVKNNQVEKNITFGYDVPKKNINFLKAYLVQLNQRACGNHNFNTTVELDIYREALRHSKGTQVTLTVGQQENIRCLTLRKTILQPSLQNNMDLANNNSNIKNKNNDLMTANTASGVKNNNNCTSGTKQTSNKTDDNTTTNKQALNIPDGTKNATEKDNSLKSKEKVDKNDTKILSSTAQMMKDAYLKFKERIERNATTSTPTDSNSEKNATESYTVTSNSSEFSEKSNDIENHNKATTCLVDYEDSFNDSCELKDVEKEIRYIEEFVSSFKRNRSESQTSLNILKKTKMTESVAYILITSKSGNKISREEVKKFQSALAEQIDLATNLPKLECFGAHKDGILYGCHNDIGAKLVESVASKTEFTTKVVEKFIDKSRRKLKIRFNSSIKNNWKKFLNLIECYNIGLNCDDWAFEDIDIFDDFIVISVEVDHASFEYILEANFRLFAGTDRLRISEDWN